MQRAEARMRFEWDQTSALLAELLNGPRNRKDKRPWTVLDVHPYPAQQRQPAETAVRITPQQLTGTLRAML